MIAILDYGAGDLSSVRLALESLGSEVVIADSPEAARGAERLVFPGIGSAASGIVTLCARRLDCLLRDAVQNRRPILGICLGMQLLFSWSDEDGGYLGLDLLPGRVRRFQFPPASGLKTYHTGWNSVAFQGKHPLLKQLAADEEFYFVHSHFVEPAQKRIIRAQSQYGNQTFTAAIGDGSVFATQFNPECSGKAGMQLLKNFLTWDGTC